MKKKLTCVLALILILMLLFAFIPAQAAGTLGVQDGVLGLTGKDGATAPLIRNGMLTNAGMDFFSDMPDEPLGELGSYKVCGLAARQAVAATLKLNTEGVLSWGQLADQLSNMLDTLKTVKAEDVDLPVGYETLAAYTAALQALQTKMAGYADAQGEDCLTLNELQALSRLRYAVIGASAGMDFTIGRGPVIVGEHPQEFPIDDPPIPDSPSSTYN